MLLASIGETIEPALIESMTAVGAGAHLWHSDSLLYFSLVPPDVGLSRALKALGFTFHEEAFAVEAPFPLPTLLAALEEGPVIIGPLDMAHLTYLPGHQNLGGVDHFVLAHDHDEGEFLRLHDPKGYPHVRLAMTDLEAAWRAAGIGYARGAFRYWSRPERLETVDSETLVRRCLEACRAAYADEENFDTDLALTGAAAFETAAAHLSAGNADALAGLLVGFCLPLGARRAHDLAALLRPEEAVLAAIKQRQATAFIDCYRYLFADDRAAAAAALLRIGDHDEAFRQALTAELPAA